MPRAHHCCGTTCPRCPVPIRWTDVPLSDKGEDQARKAGQVMREKQLAFDKIYISYLSRTYRTAQLALEQLPQGWDPSIVERSWRLNERFYGAFTGHNKRKIAQELGPDKFAAAVRDPPPLDASNMYWPGNDPKYAHLAKSELPFKESFEDTMRRVAPVWDESIWPDAAERGLRVLVISSKNAIRSLQMHLFGIEGTDPVKIDVPNGVPLVYSAGCISLEVCGHPEDDDAIEAGRLARLNMGIDG